MWTYNKKEFTDDMIPEGAIGFIYGISLKIDGESKLYIGKKNFYSDVKTKLGKKELSDITDKRKKTYKRVRKYTYKNYCSSNDIIKRSVKEGIPIKKNILKICYSKMDLTYQELKYLVKLDVLEDDKYLNDNILGKFYKSKINKTSNNE
jgi:hypothetical protein|tara:strand:- start:3783 stop:4229 length:447 start_codon:yes stop_codon:yes gene_type:complete